MNATAEALVGLMDLLEVDQFAVVGHSLGGLVSWLVAALAPDRVTRLGLVDSATTALNAVQISVIVSSFTQMYNLLGRQAVARAILRRPRLRGLMLRALFADTSHITPELAVWLLTPLTSAPGFLDALWAAPRANKLLTPETMEIPALISWGTKEMIFSVGGARRLAAKMPDATILESRGARHWPHVEQPDKFNTALVDFLSHRPVNRRTPKRAFTKCARSHAPCVRAVTFMSGPLEQAPCTTPACSRRRADTMSQSLFATTQDTPRIIFGADVTMTVADHEITLHAPGGAAGT